MASLEKDEKEPSPFAGKVFVLAGPPAVGKGTQSKRLAKRFSVVHLSTGDIFRKELAKARGTSATSESSEFGERLGEYMDRQSYVPDEIVLNYMEHRLAQDDIHQHGCILDGFPRTADQAKALKGFVDVEAFILLEVPDSVLRKRAPGRRVHTSTGDIYHTDFIPPPSHLVDSEELVRRDGDVDISVRLSVHHEQIRRVLPFFKEKVVRVNGLKNPEKVHEKIVAAMVAAAHAPPKAAAAGKQNRDDENRTCSICLDAPADFCCVPCGHQCACQECLSEIKMATGKCPICRGQITNIMKVFKAGVDDSDEGGNVKCSDDEPVVRRHGGLDDLLDNKATEDAWPEDAWPEEENGEGEDMTKEASSTENVPTLSVEVHSNCEEGGDSAVSIRIDVPELPGGATRQPVDICCAVDISGSMQQLAKYETDDGTMKDDGLSILDIVKHGVKTIMHTLEDQDRLAIVAFNANATTVLPLTHMTTEGRQAATVALEELRPSGKTNIWDGLLHGMNCLRGVPTSTTAEVAEEEAAHEPTRRQAVMLLTDGQPNVQPPRGHIVELQNYKDQYTGFDFQLNTFGFGYSLDSKLLVDLAVAGHGTYAFIPDAIILGTVFVNSVANFTSMYSQDATLNLLPRAGATFSDNGTKAVHGDFEASAESWGVAVHLGPLQHGQARECVASMTIPSGTKPYLDAVLTFAGPDEQRVRVEATAATRVASSRSNTAWLRSQIVSKTNEAIRLAENGSGKEAVALVQDLQEELEAGIAASEGSEENIELKMLHSDVAGRLSKAFRGKKRFDRWGKHYLRALVRSHQLIQCTNFMDPGLQGYGGEHFRQERSKGDEVFVALPAPVPAGKSLSIQEMKSILGSMGQSTTGSRATLEAQIASLRGGGGAAPAAPAVRQNIPRRPPSPKPDMRTYYAGAGGGCFGSSSIVTVVLANGNTVDRKVSDVQPGDEVIVSDGTTARVLCVAEVTRRAGFKQDMMHLPDCGLVISAGHPVQMRGKWQKPRNAEGFEYVSTATSDSVWNFVLNRSHSLLVNGISCVTWGHNLEDPELYHGFYGTQRIVDALSQLQGWEVGKVCIGSWMRDQSGSVVGLS